MARNTGLKNATGDYVTFVDSDDWIEKEMIESLVKMSQNADVITSNFIYNGVQQYSQLDGRCIMNSKNVKDEVLPRILGPLNNQKELSATSCGKLYKVSFLRENNLFFPSERQLIWEDLAFNLDVFKVCNSIIFVSNAFYHYDYTPGSLTHAYDPNKTQKIITMYKYLIVNSKNINTSFERLCVTFAGHIRTCIKLEVFFWKKNSLRQTLKNLKAICDEQQVQKIIKGCPKDSQSTVQNLYNNLILSSNINLIFLLAWMQNKRKKII